MPLKQRNQKDKERKNKIRMIYDVVAAPTTSSNEPDVWLYD